MRKWRQVNDGLIHSRIYSTVEAKSGVFQIPPVSGIFRELRSAGVTRNKKSTLYAHQMAVPGQRRTKNPRWELIKWLFLDTFAHHTIAP